MTADDRQTEPGPLLKRFPTYADLREKARQRLPKFAFDYVDTGVNAEFSVKRNAAAFDEVCLIPRFGAVPNQVDASVELFGQRYRLPIGIAPMGLASLVWPDADIHLARAARKAGVPYVLATGASLSIEQAAEIAGDSFWFQLYPIPANDHAVTLDLVRRAEKSGAKALILTMDTAAKPKRTRDLKNGLVPPFRPGIQMALQAVRAPSWLLHQVIRGIPKFENFSLYITGRAGPWQTAAFAVREVTGSFSWTDVERIRQLWPRALIIKGLLHPDDAKRAISAGADAVWISNHGGRNFDPAPATLDALRNIAPLTRGQIKVFIDSGVTGGSDVIRAKALGADAVFAGRAFMFSVAALGGTGANHMIEIFAEEIDSALRFVGKSRFQDVDASVL